MIYIVWIKNLILDRVICIWLCVLLDLILFEGKEVGRYVIIMIIKSVVRDSNYNRFKKSSI